MVGSSRNNTKRGLAGLFFGIFGLSLATAILKFFQFEQYLYNVALVFILVVLLVASRFGLWPGIAISILGFLCFNYFFIPPFHTLYIESFAGVIAVTSFLVAAFITSEIAGQARSKTEQARLGQQETAALNQLNMAVLGEAQAAPMLQQVVRQVSQNLKASVAAIYLAQPDKSNQITPTAIYPETVPARLENIDFFRPELVETSFNKKEPFYKCLEGTGRSAYLPLLRGDEALGVMAVFLEDENSSKTIPGKDIFNPQEKHWLLILANQATLAVDHAHLIAENALIASLKEADRFKSVLLGLVSHELRTPITAIKTAVAGLKDESSEIAPDELNEYLEVIDQESERLSRLISNLLDLSRIEAGRLEPEKGLYYLPEIIAKTIDRLNRSNTLAAHPVQTHFGEDLPLVPLDYLQIDQVVTNLLENAVKYSPPGKLICIEVCQAFRFITVRSGHGESEVTENSPGVLVEIADEGSGIPESELAHIFEKFYRVNSSKSGLLPNAVPGSGLGLAICKGIIEAHAGQIWAENRPGGGSLFSVWLPIKMINGNER